MTSFPEGNAVVYCEAAFGTPNGKTAHGLVRRTRRYRVLSVVDSRNAGGDAGEILDGRNCRIPVVADLKAAVDTASQAGTPPTHLVIGLAPDGGRLPPAAREVVRAAIDRRLHVDSGLHDFLSEDPELAALAGKRRVRIRDIRMPPHRRDLHFFNGKIEQVDCLKVALLGTDSAVGKRTTAWVLVDALRQAGIATEFVGTGQTAWMQGAEYCIILDSLVNDFVAGEIEHAIWQAWRDRSTQAIVIEGQGSLMNPAYPGGFEILAAGRPDLVILQHAPTRREYDGFPGYSIHPLLAQIAAIEMLSGRKVIAVSINHEGMAPGAIGSACEAITRETGLPACDVLVDGAGPLVNVLQPHLH